jgi:hypothetical protein
MGMLGDQLAAGMAVDVAAGVVRTVRIVWSPDMLGHIVWSHDTNVHRHASAVVVADRAAPTDRFGDDTQLEELGFPRIQHARPVLADLEVVNLVVVVDDLEDEFRPRLDLDHVRGDVVPREGGDELDDQHLWAVTAGSSGRRAIKVARDDEHDQADEDHGDADAAEDLALHVRRSLVARLYQII